MMLSQVQDQQDDSLLFGEGSNGAGSADGLKEEPAKIQFKACKGCRNRRVQCDIYKTGPPCTYCRLYDTQCVPADSKYRKRKRQDTTETVESTQLLPNTGVNNKVDDVDVLVRLHGYDSLLLDPNQLGHLLQPRAGSEENPTGTATAQSTDTETLLSGSSANANKSLTPSSFPLPSYIKRLPPSLQPEDIQYLWMKGALSLPNILLRDKLIEAFIQHVYPSLPLIDLQQFVRTVNNSGKDGVSISLILFQAIMFAGAAFVDLSDLQNVGYSTRREARKALYQKARLLYQFDCEPDRLSVVQALLLITYQHENPTDGKDERHWLSVAISLAYTIGLHRNPSSLNLIEKDLRLRKRVWWSCVMRDRLLALGMKKVPLIDDKNYDVPMLTLEDFDIPNHQDNSTMPPEWSMANNTSLLLDLATICIAKAKICLCVGHILSSQYFEYVRDQGMEETEDGKTRSRAVLAPKMLPDDADSIRHCDDELNEWFRSLPPACHYTPPNEEDLRQKGSSILVERALLHMIYYSASCTLYRPQVLTQIKTPAQAVSQDRIRASTKKATKLIIDLYRLNLTRYLPGTAVTVLFPLVTIHLMDIKSASEETREEAIEGLSQCMSVLRELRDTYHPADDASGFFETVLTQANIGIRPESLFRARDSVQRAPESESESDSESQESGEHEVEDLPKNNNLDNSDTIPGTDFAPDPSLLHDVTNLEEISGNMDFDFQNLNFVAESYANDLSFLFNSDSVSSDPDQFHRYVDGDNMYGHNPFGIMDDFTQTNPDAGIEATEGIYDDGDGHNIGWSTGHGVG
ncbi:C6 transcription factor [Xylogone sp. PMI_703]|nr:C6 transcription factor [Xylogone sp. PMI_703]